MHPPDKPSTPLLDSFQRDYLKFQGREPRTLEELAIAWADYEHRRRLAEIKAMRGKLAQLDPFIAPLAALGIRLSYRDFKTHDSGKTLRLYATLFSGGADAKLHEALTGLGFRETGRKTLYAAAGNEVVTLKHGRALTIEIDVPRKPGDPSPAVTTPPKAQLAAAEAVAEAA